MRLSRRSRSAPSARAALPRPPGQPEAKERPLKRCWAARACAAPPRTSLCAPARNPCANGGLCTVLAPGEVGCDCSHTGFGGKFCSEGEPGELPLGAWTRE